MTGQIEYRQELRKKYPDNDRLRLVAEKGDTEAQFFYGLIYELEGDHSEAARWWERAARQSESRAQKELGWLYYQGLGVEKDATAAVDLLNMSLKNGNKSALQSLDRVFKDKSSGAYDLDIESIESRIVYVEQLENQAKKNVTRLIQTFSKKQLMVRGIVKSVSPFFYDSNYTEIHFDTSRPVVKCLCSNSEHGLLDINSGSYATVLATMDKKHFRKMIFLYVTLKIIQPAY